MMSDQHCDPLLRKVMQLELLTASLLHSLRVHEVNQQGILHTHPMLGVRVIWAASDRATNHIVGVEHWAWAQVRVGCACWLCNTSTLCTLKI